MVNLRSGKNYKNGLQNSDSKKQPQEKRKSLKDIRQENDNLKNELSIVKEQLEESQKTINEKEKMIHTQKEYIEEQMKIFRNELLLKTSENERTTGEVNALKDKVENIETELSQYRYERNLYDRGTKWKTSCKQLEHKLALKEHENNELRRQLCSQNKKLKEFDTLVQEKAKKIYSQKESMKEQIEIHNELLQNTSKNDESTEINALKGKINNIESKLSQHRYERNLYYDRGSRWKTLYKKLEHKLITNGCATCKKFLSLDTNNLRQ